MLVVLIALMAGLSGLVATLTLAHQASLEHKLHQSIDASATEKRFQDIIADMNDFPGSASRDVLFLRTLALLGEANTAGKQNIAASFQAFIDKNEAYRQLYVFNAGRCAVVVSRDQAPGTDCPSTPQEVTNAAQAASNLPSDDVYVSPLVAINSLASQKKIPSLLYATHQDNNVVVAVIDANYFLEEVRRLARPDETVLLLSKEGTYLANPDPTKEWATGSAATFYKDHPGVADGTLTSDTRSLEADGRAFTFHRVHPTGGGFTLSEDGTALPSDDYYWIITSVSDSRGSTLWWRTNPYIPVILLIILLQLIIVSLSGLIFRGYGLRQEHKKTGK